MRPNLGWIMCAVMVSAQIAAALTDVYVTTNGTGVGYPTWADATNSIQGAIDIIDNNPASTVWVSNGVYAVGGANNYPTGTALTNRVAIYKAITVRSANNDPKNTIIQGVWDPVTTNGPAAVRGVYMVAGSSLIGFTVTNGATLNTDNDSEGAWGGGIWCASVNTLVSNCIIVGNSAKWSGGGAYRGTLYDSRLAGNRAGFSYWGQGGGGARGSTLYGCILSNNYSNVGGGGFQCQMDGCTIVAHTFGGAGGGGVCASTLTNCTLIGNNTGAAHGSTLYDCRLLYNWGQYGGGATEQCKLYRCTLIGNSATQGGGGVNDRCILYDCLLLTNSAQYGAAAVDKCVLTNCTLIGNSNINGGDRGGGVDNKCILYNCLLANNTSTGDGGASYNCDLYNCTVVSNTAAGQGGGVWGSNVVNSIVYFNTAPFGTNFYSIAMAANSCTTPDPGVGTGNITGDPQFVDIASGDFSLRTSSPCIDKGANADWMTYSLDLAKNQRILNGIVDMGAYEADISRTTLITVR